MKIGIFPNVNRKGAVEALKELADLKDKDIEFIVSKGAQGHLIGKGYKFGDLFEADAVITLGGDGTLIKASRECAPYGVPVLGINFGHLGFLTEAKRQDIKKVLNKLKRRDYYIEPRMMTETSLIAQEKVMQSYFSLNDVVLTRKFLSRMISVNVKVNNLLLDNYFADGVIISTPTGSTGYSLSAGGPVLDPSMSMMIITPICPHSLHSRSIAVSEDKVITLEPYYDYNNKVIVTIDGQISVDMEEGMSIEVKKANIVTKLIKLHQYNFYEVLRKKLSERDSNC